MNIFPFLKKKDIKSSIYKEERIGSVSFPDKLTDTNAFILSNTVSEIYFPIDFISDRISKLSFYISKTRDGAKETGELTRFISDINPLWSFSDLVYQYCFSYLSYGNAISYRQSPSSLGDESINTIARIDVLKPDSVDIQEYEHINPLYVKSLNDLIKKVKYNFGGYEDTLKVQGVIINPIDQNKRDDSMLLSKTPLYKSIRSINNLLATYSARYNVYVNNGMAGILVRRVSGGGMNLSEAVTPKDRKKILDDLNDSYGVTGRRNLWGVTGVPVEFINTLSSIKDLMPFEETLENSIQISGIYQIPSGLIPRKERPTYENQAGEERQAWESTIMSIAETFAQNWTKICRLNDRKLNIYPDYSSVSCLKQNEKDIQEIIKIKLENIEKANTLNISIKDL